MAGRGQGRGALAVVVAAVAVVAVGLGLRLADGLTGRTEAAAAGGGLGLWLDGLVPSLVAIGCLCVAGLARHSMPAVVGAALGLAAVLGAIEALAVVRAWLPATDPAGRPALVALAGAVAVAATLIAWRFFEAAGPRPRRWAPLRTVVAIGFVAVPFVIAVASASTAPVGDDPAAVTPYRLAARLMLAIALGALLLGASLVVLPRLAAAARQATGPSATGWADALVEAFAPVLGGRERAAAAERARLAADLHARVVPELRQAVAAAAAGPAPDPTVATRLRAALDDVEGLMVERQSVVLETFGLVAALEWLAERTEARAGVEVRLEIDPASTDARPPLSVERAAFRVALLAVDNVVRHAPGAAISVAVVATPARIGLAITDEGPGITAIPEARRPHEQRGLTDMQAEATAIGGRLAIGPRAGGPGTTVVLDWPG